MRNLQVSGGRLWASLMELARIGATPKGGVCRLAASDLDGEARRLFIRWCEEAGCTVAIDRIGNIFARRPGRNPELPPVMTGSHLDTQPTGGRFDGAYGVMAGLEIVRTLNDLGYETEAPIEIVAWTNEEGARFSPAMVGSGVFAGVFTLEHALATPDNNAPALSLGAELARIGFAGPEPVGGRDVAAYFEAHIEQGPILEAAQKPIGVVTGAQGQRWYEITVTGQEAHAGPTPMPRRRDALVGAARMIDAVNRIGHAHAPHACATVGFVQVSPNSRNTIPGRVFLTVDLRHPQDAVLTQMDCELRAACAKAAASQRLEARVEEFWYFPPTPFDPTLVGAVRNAAAAQGYAHQDIISGAGHDAVYMARVAPTAMVFVPCVDGISHNEIEDAKPEDLTAGCNVLLNALLECADQVLAATTAPISALLL
ncbi:MAG: Zn-dependent hydrolase [Stellaceae bacterium]